MSDIFISYDRSDQAKAEMLAQALFEEAGWTIFWDRRIAIGSDWQETIEKELQHARAVIVLWSSASVKSHWVRDEADDGRSRNILFPMSIDGIRPPMGFRGFQTGNLADWEGARSDNAFERLVGDLTTVLGRPPSAASAGSAPLVHPKSSSEPKPPPIDPKLLLKPAVSKAVTEVKPAYPPADDNYMCRVFRSSRDEDVKTAAISALDHRLSTEFPNGYFTSDARMKDVDRLRIIKSCDGFLAIVGPELFFSYNWRLGDPAYPLRIEIQMATENNVPVFPILVRGAELRGAAPLSELGPYPTRRPIELGHDGIEKLIFELKQLRASPN